jgi:hypothetical protein
MQIYGQDPILDSEADALDQFDYNESAEHP